MSEIDTCDCRHPECRTCYPRAKAPAPIDLTVLSPREHQVLGLLAVGHRSKEIARQLFLSPKTVDTHRARIRAKMAIRTSVQWMELLRALPAGGLPR
jgi:DNA-binding CsgD family transcriptional regulator